MSYYRDENNNIRCNLLDEDALKLARSFIKYKPHRDNEPDKKGSLTPTQLRRFYKDFKQLEKKVKSKTNFEAVKPLIKMVKSKANYAAREDNPKIPRNFKSFLVENIDRIDMSEDFEAFMLHFEAVVGFYYGLPGIKKLR
ncbi:CRISPR type III-A/MTUBE-associated protein Csm2 [Desulfatibacillum alkenivorans DSM 16219]|jgi:CRISPR-associated protein Csm2|uniref:CRISPR system Cms protein Csm2 n=1 Tax=Desulfatibacillum alkenivorans DSM 16219 TaxID=1121393 RepID=A0A1M6QTE9_9BACT|nr:type III-A CRISPR-associated protein Csm2 [Desulfatibacillum alkenivorans]SHK23307.1 CRISPR type III-A/MTUBE-associated protein Csm2 [Desulfatibacillum alkenivorans DSM 16219]